MIDDAAPRDADRVGDSLGALERTLMRMLRGSLLLAAAILLAPTAFAGEPAVAKSRRQELDALDKQLFRKPLLVRADLHSAVASPGRLTELLDGSYYENADPSVAFEELAPAHVVRTSLRKNGRVLLVTLAPPSNLLPPELRSDTAPDVGVPLLVELDVEAFGGVREALASIVYFPGESPDAETVARCIARYPDHDEKRSRMRCGLGR